MIKTIPCLLTARKKANSTIVEGILARAFYSKRKQKRPLIKAQVALQACLVSLGVVAPMLSRHQLKLVAINIRGAHQGTGTHTRKIVSLNWRSLSSKSRKSWRESISWKIRSKIRASAIITLPIDKVKLIESLVPMNKNY